MPTYEYECKKCDRVFEVFQSITAAPLRQCPKCKGKVRRLIGRGSGIIFKGSGFYQTDYRSEHYKKRAAEESKTSVPTPAADAKKPAAKKEKTGQR
ncbi:MAG: FmdB family zinc ribbon protein [Kiritimatiellia bacterium]